MPGLIQRFRWRLVAFYLAVSVACLAFWAWLIRTLWGAFKEYLT